MHFDSDPAIATERQDSMNGGNTLISSVLVATEGKPSHDVAVRVAAKLAERSNSVLRIVSVIPPAVSHSAPTADAGLVQPIRRTAGRRSVRLAAVREQMKRVGVGERFVTVVSGWPGLQIVAAARRYGATLIVMGLGRHLPLDRYFGTETTLDVVRWTTVPVLAVARDTLPRRGIAAVDFEPSSADALRGAAALLGPGAEMQLIHVRPTWERSRAGAQPPPTVRTHSDPRLTMLAQDMETSFQGRIETLLLHGDPAGEILAHAGASAIELIAVGRTSEPESARNFCGTLAERLLRGAHCSVLVAPVTSVHSPSSRSPMHADGVGAPSLLTTG